MSRNIRVPRRVSTRRGNTSPRDKDNLESSVFFEESLSTFRRRGSKKGNKGSRGTKKILQPSNSISSFSRKENLKRKNDTKVKEIWTEKHVVRNKSKILTNHIEEELVDFDRIFRDIDNNMRVVTNDPNDKTKPNFEEEEEEEIISQKFRKKKRFKPVLVLIQDTVEKNVEILMKNPEKLKKLKRSIEKYESQNTMFGKRMKNRNMIKKNVNEARNYRGEKGKRLNKFFTHRKELHKWAKYNRNRLNNSHIKKTEKQRQNYEKKYEAARKVKESLPGRLMEMEKKQKWSFIVSLYSRFFILYDALEKKREEEYEKKRRMELTKIVFQRMMPIVRNGRHERWVESWGRFKKHWYFFKLWIQIKKKKQATQTIKSFLKSTGIDFTFVKRVNSFRGNIRKCQYYVRKFKNVELAREMVNLFKYTLVESKIILDRNLDRGRTNFVLRNETGGSGVVIGSGKEEKNPSENQSKSEKTFYEKSVKPNASGPVCQLRPSLDERLKNVRDFLKEKRNEYLRVYPRFEKELRDYRNRLQKQECMEKATKLLGRHEEDEDEGEGEEDDDDKNKKKGFERSPFKEYGELIENGKVVPEPKAPFLRCFISDKEMEVIVRKGLKNVREKEAKIFMELKKKQLNFKSLLEKEKVKVFNYDLEIMNCLRDYFGENFDERKKLLTNATNKVNDIRKQRSYLHTCEVRLKKKY